MKTIVKLFSFNSLAACLCLLSVSFTSPLWAHGSDEPQHGGQVVMSGDVTFELVNSENSVELFLLDDGDEMDTSGQTAKIKLKDETPARFVEMEQGGGNRFVISDFSLSAGANVLVLITKADGYSKIGANFLVE